MRAFNIYIKNGLWFFIELVLIFVIIEGIYYAFGYYGELTIAVALLIFTSLIFIIGLVNARLKDKRRGA
ncbi:hypothetical protein BMS3Abin03_02775 [bacterium BMS3Abin03]|nr:hypothetical protein BMS3Abin03_02775 [bacterium BMS3Abin03]